MLLIPPIARSPKRRARESKRRSMGLLTAPRSFGEIANVPSCRISTSNVGGQSRTFRRVRVGSGVSHATTNGKRRPITFTEPLDSGDRCNMTKLVVGNFAGRSRSTVVTTGCPLQIQPVRPQQINWLELALPCASWQELTKLNMILLDHHTLPGTCAASTQSEINGLCMVNRRLFL